MIKYASFPEFGSTDADIIYQNACTSLAGITATVGGITGAETGAGAGTNSYTSGGVLLSASAGIKWTGWTTAQKNSLIQAGTLTCWIEKEYVSGATIGVINQYAIGAFNTAFNAILRFNTSAQIFSFMNTTLPAAAARAVLSNTNTDNYVRLDLSWIGRRAVLFVDYFPVSENLSTALVAADFTNITLGGSTATPTPPTSARVKNIMVSTRPITIPVAYKLARVNCFGHSYMAMADYTITNCLILGQAYNAAGAQSGYFSADVAAIPTIHRELHKRGIGLGNDRIHNYAYGGATLYAATGGQSWQRTKAKTDGTRFCSTMRVAMLLWGANDVVACGTNTWASQMDSGGTISAASMGGLSWRAYYQARIDELITDGADLILIGNQPSLNNQVAYQSQIYMNNVDSCNADIALLVAANTQCHLVDLFTEFGGHSTSSSDWGGTSGSDAAHPDAGASGNKIGIPFFNALYANM